jgi:hypothetical protein
MASQSEKNTQDNKSLDETAKAIQDSVNNVGFACVISATHKILFQDVCSGCLKVFKNENITEDISALTQKQEESLRELVLSTLDAIKKRGAGKTVCADKETTNNSVQEVFKTLIKEHGEEETENIFKAAIILLGFHNFQPLL